MHPALPALSLVCLTTLAAAAQAQDGTGTSSTSRITQVTVYPGSATVQRTLSVPAGARQAVFACLPAGLMRKRCRSPPRPAWPWASCRCASSRAP